MLLLFLRLDHHAEVSKLFHTTRAPAHGDRQPSLRGFHRRHGPKSGRGWRPTGGVSSVAGFPTVRRPTVPRPLKGGTRKYDELGHGFRTYVHEGLGAPQEPPPASRAWGMPPGHWRGRCSGGRGARYCLPDPPCAGPSPSPPLRDPYARPAATDSAGAPAASTQVLAPWATMRTWPCWARVLWSTSPCAENPHACSRRTPRLRRSSSPPY